MGGGDVNGLQKHIVLTLEDASDIPEGVSVTEKQPVAKTHALASGFSGEQFPVNEKINTEDAARLSEESRPICQRVVQYSQIDSIGVSGDKKGLHWYQWYDRYQWKSTLFQWFYW